MVLLAEIAVEDNNKLVVDSKNVIEDISLRRIDINEKFKSGKRCTRPRRDQWVKR